MAEDSTLRDLLTLLGEGVREPIRTLADGLAEVSRSPEVAILRQTLKTVGTVGAATGAASPEVAEALSRLRVVAERLRREGVDPALGIANLVGDCLDGLEVLVATEAIPLPVELEELRLALIRLRRPEVRLDLEVPATGAQARLAGRVVRVLVEGAEGVAESPASLADLEEAVAQSVAGGAERTYAHDPTQPVKIRARVRADLLTLEVADRTGTSAAPQSAGAEPQRDDGLVRRVMDGVTYERGEGGGVLRMTKRLRSWQLRRRAW